MDNVHIAREWFIIADSDLSSAEYLQNMRPVPIEIIGYHCQQSAEKYLKGFIALHGELLSRSHDLVLLNKLCRKVNESFNEILEECLTLTDFV